MGNGQGNAFKHLGKHFTVFDKEKDIDRKQRTLSMTGPSFSAKSYNEALFEEFVMDLKPFSFLETPGRKHSTASLPLPKDYGHPSDDFFRRKLEDEYTAIRKRLRELFSIEPFLLFFSLTMDGWKCSLAGRSMYAMRIRFLTEDFELIEIPVEISAIPGKEARVVSHWVQSGIQNFGLDMKNCILITADGAEKAAVGVLNSDLKDAFKSDSYFIPIDEDINWKDAASMMNIPYLWCMDHRASLVIRKTFTGTHFLPQVDVAKDLVQMMRKTNKIRIMYDQERQALPKPPPIIQPYSGTRYGSALIMGSTIILNESIIKTIRQTCADSSEDMKKEFAAKDVPNSFFGTWKDQCRVFGPLGNEIQSWAGSKYCTGTTIITGVLKQRAHLHSLTGPWQSSRGPQFLAAARENFDHYFQEGLLEVDGTLLPMIPVVVLSACLNPDMLLSLRNADEALILKAKYHGLFVRFDGLGWVNPPELSENAKKTFVAERRLSSQSSAMMTCVYETKVPELMEMERCAQCARYWRKFGGLQVNLLRCQPCHCAGVTVLYCSPECQKAGWRAHRTVCKK